MSLRHRSFALLTTLLVGFPLGTQACSPSRRAVHKSVTEYIAGQDEVFRGIINDASDEDCSGILWWRQCRVASYKIAVDAVLKGAMKKGDVIDVVTPIIVDDPLDCGFSGWRLEEGLPEGEERNPHWFTTSWDRVGKRTARVAGFARLLDRLADNPDR